MNGGIGGGASPYANVGAGAQPNVMYPSGDYVNVGGGAAPQMHGIAVGGCYRPQEGVTPMGQCGAIGDGVQLNHSHSGIGGGAAPNVLNYQGEGGYGQQVGARAQPAGCCPSQQHVMQPTGGEGAAPCNHHHHDGPAGIGGGAGPNVLHYQGQHHGHF